MDRWKLISSTFKLSVIFSFRYYSNRKVFCFSKISSGMLSLQTYWFSYWCKSLCLNIESIIYLAVCNLPTMFSLLQKVFLDENHLEHRLIFLLKFSVAIKYSYYMNNLVLISGRYHSLFFTASWLVCSHCLMHKLAQKKRFYD